MTRLGSHESTPARTYLRCGSLLAGYCGAFLRAPVVCHRVARNSSNCGDLVAPLARRVLTNHYGRNRRLRDLGSHCDLINRHTFNLIVKHSYQYDALDRIEKETVEPEPTPFTVPIALMTYDADDRLDTFNGQTCLSDLDGNLVTGPLGGNVTGFTFDARNRLTEVGNATFAYDSEGRRVSKTENGTTTTYVHDPQSPLSRLLSATNGNTSTFYVYTPAGMLLFEDTPSTTGIRVPHHDYRGSTVALSNGTGSVIGRVTYGTYGEVVSRTGDTDTRFLYHGAYGVETDANGLCLMRARYYSPQTRRFLNADPIQFGGGVNWYGFVGSNPVARIDPDGLDIIYDKAGGDHSGITISDPQSKTGYTRYDYSGVGAGWQTPKEQLNAIAGVKGQVDKSNGQLIPNSDIIVIKTSPQEDAAARAWAETRMQHPPSFQVILYNCSDFAAEVLNKALIDESRELAESFRNPLLTTPQGLYNNLEDYINNHPERKGKP